MEELQETVTASHENPDPQESLQIEENLTQENGGESPHIVEDTSKSGNESPDKNVNKDQSSMESEFEAINLNHEEKSSEKDCDKEQISASHEEVEETEETVFQVSDNSCSPKKDQNGSPCSVSYKANEASISFSPSHEVVAPLVAECPPETDKECASINDTPIPSPKGSPVSQQTQVSNTDNSSPSNQSSNTASPRLHQQIATPTPPTPPEDSEQYKRLQNQLRNYEAELEQLKKALAQKDNTINLFQRENNLLEKEKLAFRKEKELAVKEKESIVITFATKEKSLIDAKKQKELVEKQLADSRKEVKNISTKFVALNEEKSRITYMLDEKCNEIKKFQKEIEKHKADFNNLEMKFKWNSVKLAQETEAKLAAEKKLEEERNAPKPHEEQAKEKIKMEYEATTILLKHEIEKKDKTIESLTKEQKAATEKINHLQENLEKKTQENTSLARELECLRQEHVAVQSSYSEEMLNSAKLRGQLEELQVLRTQNTLNEDKINTLNETLRQVEEKLADSTQDIEELQAKEKELLSINKEMSEMIVGLQNEICLQTSKVKGIEAENEILKKEKLDFDTKYQEIESQLKQEIQQKNDDRLLLTKHLSEKTKMYELVKVKLENVQGDFDATKKKHSQVVKELQREIQKFKKISEENSTSPTSIPSMSVCRNCHLKSTSQEQLASNHSRGSNNSRSDSESEVQSNTSTMNREVEGPSKQHLVERILRLQAASARQTEKIDFLENHTLSLVAELQKKSKVVQYYMMRDQAGALTSTKSDQNKTELAKYGGVMSAIYSGIKGPNQSMTLELSLEINKKLQAVLEDTLLKNITLKENLDVLGLEVDKLTRKLAQLQS